MKKKFLKYIILLFFILVFLYAAITAAGIWKYGNMDEKCPSDTAIVLGAGTYNGQVSPVFRERLNHGIWLYKNGYIKTLILTGGCGEGNEVSDAYTAKLYTQSQGIPETDIFIEEKSTITQENLQYAKEIMDVQGYKTAIIVSDPLHMKRAMLMAGDYGIQACSSPTPTSMYRSWKSKIPFLGREVFFYIGYQFYRQFQ